MKLSHYKSIVFVTLVTIFFLILVGSIVRATGSGLGCPDWPKCFGTLVPPTDVAQLPSDYKTRFAIQGKEIADFDAFKTWTEYLNRLLGVVVGFQVFLIMIYGIKLRREKDVSLYLSISLFLIVGLQGWIGAKVVSSNLASLLITIHMLMAMVTTCVIIEIHHRLINQSKEIKLNKFYVSILALAFLQIVLGTQVRESVDIWMHNIGLLPRTDWFDSLPFIIWVHRTAAIVIVGLLLFKIKKLKEQRNQITLDELRETNILLLLVTLNYFSGMAFKYLDFPGWNQPIHLLLASMFLGQSYYLVRKFR